MLLNRNIIRETLIKDLAIHKGLKVNALFNLILIREEVHEKWTFSYVLTGDYYISVEAIIITSEEDIDKFIESRRIIEKKAEYKYPL